MADTQVKKTILNELHDLVAEALHLILVLPVAALKAIVAGLTHVLTELEKF